MTPVERAATLDAILGHLARLVACDTQNPPRAPQGVRALFETVRPVLESSGFVVGTRDLGDGCQWLHARRGAPGPIVNVHIDTVPADPGWRQDPHVLVVKDHRAVGLGACDIKGALAAFLVAAAAERGSVELVLTSDEEAGSSRCVRTFVSEHSVRGREVLVAEPTRCQAVLAHRGIATCTGVFSGVAGHASQRRALDDSAVHEAIRWSARALSAAALSEQEGGPGLHGMRFNLGRIEGGLKPNMIASSASVKFGVRPATDPRAALAVLCDLAPDPSRVTWEPGYLAPCLPAPGMDVEPARGLAKRYLLDEGAPVDFFTEAALFSEAGAVAVVIGSGDIADAHTAGESVAVSELVEMEGIYGRVLGRSS